MDAEKHYKVKLTMIRRFLAFLMILICFFVLYWTYFEGLFYNKRNSDGVFQKYKGIHSNLVRKYNSTAQKHIKSLDLIRNGIYWSSYAESFVPKGMLICSLCFPLSHNQIHQ